VLLLLLELGLRKLPERLEATKWKVEVKVKYIPYIAASFVVLFGPPPPIGNKKYNIAYLSFFLTLSTLSERLSLRLSSLGELDWSGEEYRGLDWTGMYWMGRNHVV
jgi:hypothetical protein